LGVLTLDTVAARVACPLCGGLTGQPHLRNARMTVWRCPCGMAFAGPDMPEEPYGEAYFESRQFGASAVAAMKRRSYCEVLAQVERLLGPLPRRRLLDVGCGYGWSLDAAAQAGLEAYGVEASAEARRQAGARHEVRPDVRDYGDGTFDVVTLVDVVEHVRDPVRLLQAAAQALAPGGALVLVTPDLSSLSARLLRGWWPYVIPEHLVYFDRRTIRRALGRAGLEVEYVGPFRKFLRADYVASMLTARRDGLGRFGATLFGFLGGAEVGLLSGDLVAAARKPGLAQSR
jgi:SAM-dependent methyltransferase